MFGTGTAGILRRRYSLDAGDAHEDLPTETPRRASAWSTAPDLGIRRNSRAEHHGAHHTHKLGKQPSTEGNLRISLSVECSDEVMCCSYNETANLLAVGLVEGSIQIFSPESGSALYNLTDDDITRAYLPCTSLNFKPPAEGDKSDNLLLATYASGMVKLWHVSSGQCLHTIHEPRQTLTSTFQAGGEIFITAGSDDKILVYDTATKTTLKTCQPSMARDIMDGHRCRVFSVKFHPKQVNEYISGGWDDTVQFWDIRQQHATRRIFGPHICGDSLAIDRYHNHILTGSWRKEKNLQIWDYDSGQNIKTVLPDVTNSLLYCAQWLGRDRITVGGCDANMVRVLDRGTLQTTGRLMDLPRGVYCMDDTKQGPLPRFVVGTSKSLFFLEVVQTQTD